MQEGVTYPCSHQFIAIEHHKVTYPYATVVCAYCGQVRKLFETGVVRISVMEGKLSTDAKPHEAQKAN